MGQRTAGGVRKVLFNLYVPNSYYWNLKMHCWQSAYSIPTGKAIEVHFGIFGYFEKQNTFSYENVIIVL